MILYGFVFSVEAVAYLDVMILRKAAVFVLLQEQELPTVTNPNKCCVGSCRASALCTPGNDLMGCDRAACIYFDEHYDRRIRERLNGIAEIS